MNLGELLYRLGEKSERLFSALLSIIRSIITPKAIQRVPNFPLSTRLVMKKGYTIHEVISLHLQLSFLAYLGVNAVAIFLPNSFFTVLVLGLIYLLYLRWIFGSYGHYLVDPKQYVFFYGGVSTLAFLSFLGFVFLRERKAELRYYYIYVSIITIIILLFRWYFKHAFGRDYTYGVVEEVKKDLLRVFVHDDIGANVKPGYYWVPAVPDAEPGRIVKLLVEERFMRSSVPVRVLEVYLDQSSQTDTEPKAEAE